MDAVSNPQAVDDRKGAVSVASYHPYGGLTNYWHLVCDRSWYPRPSGPYERSLQEDE
jgi:hypothetical protein